MWRIFAFEDCWRTAVPRFTDFGIEFHASKKWHIELLCSLFRAPTRENIDLMLAMGTDEVTHVLDHADNVDLHLTKHFNGFAGVLQGDVRGSRDDNRTGPRQMRGLSPGLRNPTEMVFSP